MSTNTEPKGFMATRYEGRVRDLDTQEEELKRMQDEFKDSLEDQIEDLDPGIEQIDEEEATFKKRYGDLRRYSNKQLKEMKKRLEELEAKTVSRTIPDIPEDEEEYEEWVKNYPDAAKFISVVATKEAKKATESLAEQVAELKKQEQVIAREKAAIALTKMRPDWEQIQSEAEFWDWVEDEEQPKWVMEAMEGIDYKSIARVIDLYKLDKGRTTPNQETKKKPREANLDAADLSIKGTRHTDPKPSSGKVWKESDVQKMNSKQYEAAQDEIMKAINEGRFVHDISG